MTTRSLLPIAAIALSLLETASVVRGAAGADWTQWGGPGRNFMSDAKGLASSWPAGGPKKRWSRALGEGHSSILFEGGKLYTMYRPLGLLSVVRRSQEEVIVALDAATGKTLWEFKYPSPTDGVDFSQGAGPHATPLIVGSRLYATSSRRELFALDKAIGQPVWSPADHLLFVSSAYDTGSRAIELHQAAGKTTATEKWFNNRMRVHIGTVIRLGDYAYGSSGDFGPAFITAVDMKTGKVAWQDRSFSRAQLLYADGKLIVLDEDGNLGLATVSPAGLKVLARAPILEHLSWTPPTLAGTQLFVRDRKTIASFDLGL